MKRTDRLAKGLRRLLLGALALPMLATFVLALALTLRGGWPQDADTRSAQPVRTFAPSEPATAAPTALSEALFTRAPDSSPDAEQAAPTALSEALFTRAPDSSPDAEQAAPAALSRGDRGGEVTRLQERLAALGYPVGAADGAYGEDTAACVAAFQALCALPQTGDADVQTLERLFADGAPTAEPSGGEAPYIGNRNSMKFHRADCASVQDMSEKNKAPLMSREEAIAGGYTPCKRCNP